MCKFTRKNVPNIDVRTARADAVFSFSRAIANCVSAGYASKSYASYSNPLTARPDWTADLIQSDSVNVSRLIAGAVRESSV